MSHIETAVLASKRIEAILREGFAAEGRGLHEYLGSVEHRIPSPIVKKARYIASVRNQVVHQDGVIFDLAEFNQAVEDVVLALNTQLEQERVDRENQERLKREEQAKLFRQEHERKLQESANQNHQNAYYEQSQFEKEENNSVGFVGFIWAALVILVIYLWIQLNNEKDKRKNEEYSNKRAIASLSQQLKNERSKVAALQLQQKKISDVTAKKSDVSNPAAKGAVNSIDIKVEPPRASAADKPIDLKPIQQRLNDLGYQAGAVDGLPGRSTTLAIQEFQKRNNLNATGTLLEQELTLLKSEKAIKNEVPTQVDNSLLAKARSATDEYERAYNDIKVNFVNFVKDKTTITLGKPDIFQSANGTYSVRVPVTWTMPEREVLTRLNRYFNDYDRKPLAFSSDRMRSENNRVLIRKRNAESSTAIKPYSGRLFGELQKIELAIEVSLGNKKSRIIIAGNASCHVGCNYSERGSDSWIIQSNGKPGVRNLNWKQESPIIIEGLTENDLKNAGLPVAVVKYVIR